MMIPRSIWHDFLAEASAAPRPAIGTELASGATLLGKGRTADVWALGDCAVKLFRHRSGIDVPGMIAAEIATYGRIPANGVVMPRLLEHGIIESEPSDPNICGWAIFSRLKGEPLSFDRMHAILQRNSLFVEAMVSQTLLVETWLNNGDPLAAWHHNFVQARVVRLQVWRQEGRGVEDADVILASRIHSFIKAQGGEQRFIHGDFNPPNILVTQADDSEQPAIGFVDPMISFDTPESNWRHFTAVPELADALLAEYGARTGSRGNMRLMYAMGAFTQLYNAISTPSQSRFRRQALRSCLERAGL